MSRIVTDQMGEQVEVPDSPLRIISLVPSQTELLFDLGLDEEIVGVTRFCIHPDEAGTKERVGGTKKFDFEKIKALDPDLIIGNKEENYEEGINELKKQYPVWMSDIVTLDDAYDMMRSIGEITGKHKEADKLVNEIKSGFDSLATGKSQQTTGYFIWRKPYMVAGQGTFINEMLNAFGVRNAFADSRYPEVTAEQISEAKPDLIFLSSEPYSFSEKHIAEFQELCPDAKIYIVDGEMFSWYGSRLRYAPEYLRQLRENISRL